MILDLPQAILAAVDAIRSAETILIGAGAGMGVDSGLPDFRGNEGFWEAYPAFKKLGLSFVDLANPDWFHTDPTLAWGFYGHRRNLYRATIPHAGFAILRKWVARAPLARLSLQAMWTGTFRRQALTTSESSNATGRWNACSASRPALHRFGQLPTRWSTWTKRHSVLGRRCQSAAAVVVWPVPTS